MVNEAGLEAVRDMFRHHAWATLKLLEYCAALTPDQLGGSVPGTRGPILETLEHIVGADQGYLRRFGVTSEPMVKEDGDATIEAMRAAFVRQAQAWQSVLEQLPEFDITIAG